MRPSKGLRGLWPAVSPLISIWTFPLEVDDVDSGNQDSLSTSGLLKLLIDTASGTPGKPFSLTCLDKDLFPPNFQVSDIISRSLEKVPQTTALRPKHGLGVQTWHRAHRGLHQLQPH